jgi:hypothetical protein
LASEEGSGWERFTRRAALGVWPQTEDIATNHELYRRANRAEV